MFFRTRAAQFNLVTVAQWSGRETEVEWLRRQINTPAMEDFRFLLTSFGYAIEDQKIDPRYATKCASWVAMKISKGPVDWFKLTFAKGEQGAIALYRQRSDDMAPVPAKNYMPHEANEYPVRDFAEALREFQLWTMQRGLPSFSIDVLLQNPNRHPVLQ